MSAKRLTEAQIWLVEYLSERYSSFAVKPEHRFCDRLWRFDVAVTDFKYAFEIEGGLFMPVRGRHARGAGIRNDIEKYNEAAARGWKVFRFLPEQVLKGEAKAFIERWL